MNINLPTITLGTVNALGMSHYVVTRPTGIACHIDLSPFSPYDRVNTSFK